MDSIWLMLISFSNLYRILLSSIGPSVVVDVVVEVVDVVVVIVVL